MPTAVHSSPVVATCHEALQDLVAVAVHKQVPLVDYGIAHAGLGHRPPAAHTRFIQGADPANGGVLEHYLRDLTVRAAAGITVGELQKALKPSNQFVPIDADDDITLGEAIHHNMWGPLRVGYGSLRDLLLGLHYIDGQARDIHVGGRTVKNVAGYDLSRFMVGSLGELGIVHEATLRTYAIPAHVLCVELMTTDPAIFDERGTDLILSDAKPVHLSYRYHAGGLGGLGSEAASGGGREAATGLEGTWIVHLAYFGQRTGCLVQLRSLETFFETVRPVRFVGTSEGTLEQDAIERAGRRAWRRSAGGLVKIIVPPASTGRVATALANWMRMNERIYIDALPMHGCVYAGGNLSAAAALDLDATLAELLAPIGGLRVWHARPPGAEMIDPFGSPQGDYGMLLKLKQTMDPRGVLNPGRFLK